MEEKYRLDRLLMKKSGYGREFAKEIIEKGVLVNGRPCSKPGEKFAEAAEIVFTPPKRLYVSRGGYKLEHALEYFGIDLRGKRCLDAGASTGGFTDCMLQAGAAIVYAIDVGSEQLAPSLRQDPRVVSMEDTDLRAISPEMLGGEAEFLTADLSFISVIKVLGSISRLLSGEGVLLVKPQFEAGRGHLSKKGVVRDEKTRLKALERVYEACGLNGLEALGHTESPMPGHEGNIEYLLHVRN